MLPGYPAAGYRLRHPAQVLDRALVHEPFEPSVSGQRSQRAAVLRSVRAPETFVSTLASWMTIGLPVNPKSATIELH